MRACSQVNVWASTATAVLIWFAGCGSHPSPPAASAPAESGNEIAAPAVPASPAASSSEAMAPPPSSPGGAASAPANAGETPDRNMNDIRAVVANHRETFRSCYDRAERAHPGIKGTFTLKFVIAPDGSVKSADADPTRSQIHAAELESCSITALKALTFPKSRRGMESTVSYPFDFNPKAVAGSMPSSTKGSAP